MGEAHKDASRQANLVAGLPENASGCVGGRGFLHGRDIHQGVLRHPQSGSIKSVLLPHQLTGARPVGPPRKMLYSSIRAPADESG